MVAERSTRLLVLAVLCGVLFALLVAAGTLTPAPGIHDYPDAEDLDRDYAAYQGERVTVAGIVVRTDPVVIEADYGADRPLVLSILDLEEPVEVGQELRVFGTARPDRTIAAHETVVVSPWEVYYAWGASFVAGVWVLARFLRRWRFDGSTLDFSVREGRDA